MSNSQDDRAAFVGRLLVLGAALMWSINGLFVKAPLFDVWSPEERGIILAFWRALFAGLWLLPAVRRPRFRMALLPMIVAFTAMSLSFLQSMSLTTAANAGWLQAAAPLWVLVLGVGIWREPLDRRDLAPLVWGLSGIVLILIFELTHASSMETSLLGPMLGVVSGVCYAIVVLSIRRLRDENGAWLIALNLLASAAIIGPFCLTQYGVPSTSQLFALCAFGLLQMGVPYLLMAAALRRISSQEAAGIGLVEPVLVPVWVWLVWGEVPAWWTLAGGAAILCGLILRYRRREPTIEIPIME